MAKLHKSIRTKILNFRYSEDERNVLCDLLGNMQHMHELIREFIDPEKLVPRADDPSPMEPVAMLEHGARLAIIGALVPSRRIDREKEYLSQLSRFAGPLLEALNGHDRNGVPIGKALVDYEIMHQGLFLGNMKACLEWLVEAEEEIKQQFREHFSQSFAETHNPPYFDYIRLALRIWKLWRMEEPGGSKEGGPAARYLVAAANPMLRYAKKELGLHMRRKGSVELTEDSAGSLIAYLKKNYREQSASFLNFPDPEEARLMKELTTGEGKKTLKSWF